MKKMFRKGLTKPVSLCFIVIDEANDSHQRPRQARCRPPLHYRDPPRLLAPPPHPPSLRLRRLRSRRGPPRLGIDRQLSRRTHQADQPLNRTETPRPTMVAQLPKAEGHLGAHLRTQPQTDPAGPTLIPEPPHEPNSRPSTQLRRPGIHPPGRPS